MQRIIESRNKREGGYTGRWHYDRRTGHRGRLRHGRAGSGDGFQRITLREWSRA